MKIPPVKIVFSQDDRKEIFGRFEDIFNTGSFTLGKYGKELEANWAVYTGTKYAVTVDSGTSSLEIPVRYYLKDAKKKKVIVPTNTFIATASAVKHAGGDIVLGDVSKETLALDPDRLEDMIDNETAGVVFVHIGGYVPSDIERVAKICKNNGLFLVEDAAHAHGSRYRGKKAGTFGDAASFSLYPTKIITSGEGGLISTNDEGLNEFARVIRDQGKAGFYTADFIEFGHNFRMPEMQAATGLTHLKHLDDFIGERNEIARSYDEMFDGSKVIDTMKIDNYSISNYYKYVAFLKPGIDRSKLKAYMKENGVGLSGEVYEAPLHRQKAFRDFNFKENEFPVADEVCRTQICLPIFNGMKAEEIDYVHKLITEYKQ